ncbi:MAG: HIT domain-containing protein [Thermoplasmata archaeon]|nr:HIT domain-containing protein [Thermoplasmata archaeon]
MTSHGTKPAAGCVFCEIIAHSSPAYVVFEDESTMAFLDLFPFTRGHLLVVPKHHGERLTDLPPESQAALIRTLDIMCRRAERLAPDYNVALNAGAAAGQIIFHVHFHVIPRYGAANPFHPTTRARLSVSEAQALTSELSSP